MIKIKILDEIEKMGFIKDDYKKLNNNDFDELLYCREDQKVLREINKFIKK